jgi:sulfur carrier protein ThiS
VKVEVRTHGHLLRYTGCGSLSLELPAGCTLEEVLTRLGLPERHSFAIFVNLEHGSLTTRLRPGDCVDLIPAEQGG